MPFIEWSQDLSVNIDEIDDQHRKLVDLINLLYDSMKEGKGKDELGKILNDLADNTVHHFETEEKLLQKYDYPEYASHKKEHDDLARQVSIIKAQYEKGNTTISIEMLGFLKSWLNNHILTSDKKYSTFLIVRGVV
ncbi:MAG TPA: bacteriohemerythrin [Candidatus Acidoferrales bacterium]|nr:bacteriohemerythrin [Candidatus Acidoferrales bacterium]